MSKDSILKQKSMAFARRTVRLYQFLTREKQEVVMSKQVLRSGTSIGANIAEAIYGSSRKDFVAKLQIAKKRRPKLCIGLNCSTAVTISPRHCTIRSTVTAVSCCSC